MARITSYKERPFIEDNYSRYIHVSLDVLYGMKYLAHHLFSFIPFFFRLSLFSLNAYLDEEGEDAWRLRRRWRRQRRERREAEERKKVVEGEEEGSSLTLSSPLPPHSPNPQTKTLPSSPPTLSSPSSLSATSFPSSPFLLLCLPPYPPLLRCLLLPFIPSSYASLLTPALSLPLPPPSHPLILHLHPYPTSLFVASSSLSPSASLLLLPIRACCVGLGKKNGNLVQYSNSKFVPFKVLEVG